MNGGGKTCWKAILVQALGGAGRGERTVLESAERLAALYRFQSGQASSDHCFVHLGEGRREVVDPGEVDWETFPVLAAIEAVTRDEIGRLRRLVRSGVVANLVDEPIPLAALEPTALAAHLLPSEQGKAG